MKPYQLRWVSDTNRLRVANKARQIGWTFTFAWEAFLGAAFGGNDQLLVSSGERAAQEILHRAKLWLTLARECGVALEVVRDSTTELEFANGKKIISLAQNPSTVRGYPGDVYLDEFAHHSRAKEIYTAILPAITRGYRCSVASTPLGQSGPFYDIVVGDNRFSKHRVTIDDAMQDGLAVDIGILRESMDDESYRQEFLCEFVDESTAFLPYDLFLPCVGQRAERGAGSVYMGVDVGRRKDITVIFVVQQLGDQFITQRVECLRGQPFEMQRKVIRQVWAEEGATRGAIDSTGIGAQLAEELQKTLNIEPVTFTNDWKEQAAVSVRRLFERRALTIPDDRDLFADIHSIKRTVTSAGNIRFDADRTDAGHADRFWAMALAVHAAQKPRPSVKVY